jgi:hypothetical protein
LNDDIITNRRSTSTNRINYIEDSDLNDGVANDLNDNTYINININKKHTDLNKIDSEKFNNTEPDADGDIGISVKVLRAVLRILSLKMMPTFPNPYLLNPCILSETIKIAII